MLKKIVRAVLSLQISFFLFIFAPIKFSINEIKSESYDANGIIGREYEQKLILERCKSNKAELIAIYGRRRVGKTFLVRKIFNDQFAFSFIGMYEVSRAVQLE